MKWLDKMRCCMIKKRQLNPVVFKVIKKEFLGNFWRQPPVQGEISYCLALFYVKFILAHRICPNTSVGGTGTGVCPRQVLNGGSVGGSVPGGSW